MSERDVEKEVRFAVVMYGGVSLAVYMNGISQELLAMARSTRGADGPRTDDGKSSEGVYARIAEELERRAGMRVRFVIDILSGTSAGGINAVCLAKALATGGSSLNSLERTWLENGDIDTLLNDERSDRRRYRSADPKTSLLNSQRMSGMLLQAFREMDRELGADRDAQPLVRELDLYVTATDLRGLTAPIMTSDGSVDERIYKQVFHFEKRAGDATAGDFTAELNPMLAFASRCTSSFPAAFEPMTLEQLEACRQAEDDRSLPPGFQVHRWGKFFAPYLPNAAAETFGAQLAVLQQVEFADGGYLDNRPFGYATAAIATRYATGPVERRLLFIDPSPETSGAKAVDDRLASEALESIAATRTTFVKNVALALTTLPRYETIRGDIEAIEGRNRWFQRVRNMMAGIDATLRQSTESVRGKRQQAARNSSRQYREQFADESLTAAVDLYGPAYAAYHRAKVEALTDELALMITRAAGLDQRTEHKTAVATLVSAWREQRFVADPPEGGARASENQFLMRYDLGFRLRRLNFLRLRIERMLSEGRLDALMLRLPEGPRPLREHERAELWRVHHVVGQQIVSLYELRRKLLALGGANPLQPLLGGGLLDGLAARLDAFVGSSRATRVVEATDLIATFEPQLAAIAESIAGFVKDGVPGGRGTWQVAEALAAALPREGAPELGDLRSGLRRMYYEQFDLRDSMVYPFLTGEDYGEGSSIDVLRISPIDAGEGLWKRASNQPKKNKLAGEAVGAFAAFFDREFRKNDILWGRLDGAERIIQALLPGDDAEVRRLRSAYTVEVQRRILREYLGAWIAERRASPTLQSTLNAALTAVPSAESADVRWRDAFQLAYANVDTSLRLDAKAFERLGRSSQIASAMVKGLGKTPHAGWWSFASGCIRTLSPGVLGFARAKAFFRGRSSRPASALSAPTPPPPAAISSKSPSSPRAEPVARRSAERDRVRQDSSSV